MVKGPDYLHIYDLSCRFLSDVLESSLVRTGGKGAGRSVPKEKQGHKLKREAIDGSRSNKVREVGGGLVGLPLKERCLLRSFPLS